MSLPAHLEDAPASANARARARRRLKLSVSARLPTGARNAVVHDISAGGLLLEADAALADGETLAIELPDSRRVEARVVWTSGRFFGCAFAEAIPSGLVSASLLRSDPLPRAPGTVTAACAVDEEANDRLGRGTLPTAARIQIVVTISLALWAAIGTAVLRL